jgi:hypothetical protein
MHHMDNLLYCDVKLFSLINVHLFDYVSFIMASHHRSSRHRGDFHKSRKVMRVTIRPEPRDYKIFEERSKYLPEDTA